MNSFVEQSRPDPSEALSSIKKSIDEKSGQGLVTALFLTLHQAPLCCEAPNFEAKEWSDALEYLVLNCGLPEVTRMETERNGSSPSFHAVLPILSALGCRNSKVEECVRTSARTAIEVLREGIEDVGFERTLYVAAGALAVAHNTKDDGLRHDALTVPLRDSTSGDFGLDRIHRNRPVDYPEFRFWKAIAEPEKSVPHSGLDSLLGRTSGHTRTVFPMNLVGPAMVTWPDLTTLAELATRLRAI